MLFFHAAKQARVNFFQFLAAGALWAMGQSKRRPVQRARGINTSIAALGLFFTLNGKYK
jgi:hypothetical protein